MPFINVRIAREVIAHDPDGVKSTVANAITRALVERTTLVERDVWVVFEEVPASDFYVGGVSVASELAAKEAKTDG